MRTTKANEINLNFIGSWPSCDIQVKPGDTVTFSCWIKIDSLPEGDTPETYAGARIGIDLNAVVNGLRVCLTALQSPTYPDTAQGISANYVQWGTTGWVQRTIVFVVPSSTFTHDYYSGSSIPATQITQVGPWLQVWSGIYGQYQQGNAWFAGAELYITYS